MAIVQRCLLALAIGCAILCIFVLADWQGDNARLRNFAGGMLDILDTRNVTGRGVVTGREIERFNAKISRVLGPDKKPNPLRNWSTLGPTPIEVMEQGGDCTDKSRLLVAVLREYGVAATSVMLSPCDGCEFVHTVVEAKAVDGRIVVDPSYAVSFPKPKGGYYSVRDLRKDSSIIVHRLDDYDKFSETGDQLKFDRAREYATFYSHPKTINLAKNAFTQWAAPVIALFADEPELVYRPRFLEDPKLGLTLLAGAGSLLAFAAWAAIAVRRRRWL